MDRALWLLLRLQLISFLRRWTRNLTTLKGSLLTLAGSLLLLPLLLTSLFAPRVMLASQETLIRRHGALGLLGLCLLNLLMSSDERAVHFAPAEVEFLFSGPFRRRQLLLYKLIAGLFSSLGVALLMTFVFAHHAHSFLSAFAGLFLMIELLVLVSMAIGLVVSTLGAVAFNRQRKLVLAAVVGLAAAGIWPRQGGLISTSPAALLVRLERSPIVNLLSWPCRPAVMAFTAEHLWPDLAAWLVLGLAVEAVLAAGVVALDAEYYEATAAASARRYARFPAHSQEMKKRRSVRMLVPLPMLPWWGGVGPALWRQLAALLRFPGRFLGLLAFHLCPLLPLLLSGLLRSKGAAGTALDPRFLVVALACFPLAASLFTGFDFRSDVDHMDSLKSLPIPAPALAIAELVVPTFMLSLAQAACLVILAGLLRDGSYLFEALLFLPPYNALLIAVEAIFFLWFPYRLVPGSTLDFSMMGRQLLLMLAKLIVIGFALGIAGGIGAAFYMMVIARLPLALALSWLMLAGSVAALMPVLVAAFEQFDVARDTPP